MKVVKLLKSGPDGPLVVTICTTLGTLDHETDQKKKTLTKIHQWWTWLSTQISPICRKVSLGTTNSIMRPKCTKQSPCMKRPP